MSCVNPGQAHTWGFADGLAGRCIVCGAAETPYHIGPLQPGDRFCTFTLAPITINANREQLSRATWWARAWSLAYLWRERRINPNTRHMIESRASGEKTILRPTRVRITNLQSWRVHKHEKQAWARLEELSR